MNAIIGRKTPLPGYGNREKGVGTLKKNCQKNRVRNLRTLQQYELKTKDIGKASVQAVVSLANVLGCQVEDFLEY